MSTNLRNEAGTPQHLFDVLHAEYRFDVDVAASENNTKLPVYVTQNMDALQIPWAGTRVWCNPPFKDIPSWLAKAQEPTFAAFLLPCRCDRIWWKMWKPLAECHYFVGEKPHTRVAFVPPPGIEYSSNSASNCLFLFGEGTMPGLEVWRSGRTGERLP